MAEETVGYVRLEWTCKQCGTVNPGPQKTCGGCGAPQAADQEFELPPQQELVKDAAEIQRAQAGPDVHCPYCGARNVAGAKICTQCSGPLDEAAVRQAGQVLGAAQAGPVPDITCPACGAPNPASATKCKQCGSTLTRPKRQAAPVADAAGARAGGISAALIAVAILACLIVAGGVFFLTRTHDQVGVVREVSWQASVGVEELGPVAHEDWRDEVPSGAQVGQCSRKLRQTSSSPVAGAEKVCGTPYVKNQGSGYGKQVQDCEYQVYDSWCEYTVREWLVVRTEIAKGTDLNPRWPDPRLGPGQREGARSQAYRVVFLSDDKPYTYDTDDLTVFQRLEPQTTWTLKINGLGAITAVEK